MPGAVAAIRFDEIQAGVIPHALRIALPKVSTRHVFPMVNSDGGSFTDPDGFEWGSASA